MPNRLAGESSPYLLQHANNPVDWVPWGPEAFERARRENKPLLISIGYATCHWCHVMERECFEDPSIAAVMNEHLVCVKVDREERPDVDRLFMTAVQALTGQGGWPLNAFVTPDGKPFIGGTYFPPRSVGNRRAWPEVVAAIGNAWKDPATREKLVAQSEGLTQAARQWLTPEFPPGLPARSALGEQCRLSLERSFDETFGGFSPAPKFPLPVNLHYLLRYAVWNPGEPGQRARTLALTTLSAMARGGLFDHLGGGFHRYSTDEKWFLPHFEKTLYDNSQLALVYLEAAALSGEAAYADIARRTLDYLLRDLGRPGGGFFSAEDADSLSRANSSEKREGAFYLWTADEVRARLGADADLFIHRYGMVGGGNVTVDPSGEFADGNVLYEALSIAEVAQRVNLAGDEAKRRLEACRKKLFEVREKRLRPSIDDKIVSGWNGLALSALARGTAVLKDHRYLDAARQTARFLQENLADSTGLSRSWREGRRGGEAMAEDYAFLAQGALDLHQVSQEPMWISWSRWLIDGLAEKFLNPDNGALFSTSAGADPLLPIRAVEDADNVEPSAAGVAAQTLIRLGRLQNRPEDLRRANRLIDAHLGVSGERGFPTMHVASLLADRPGQELKIMGDSADPVVRAMAEAALSLFVPDLGVQWELAPGPARAVLCRDNTCLPAVTSAEDLRKLLAISVGVAGG